MKYMTAISTATRLTMSTILKGANPANLPIQQPSRLQLVVNLKTAKSLDLTLPALFLARRIRSSNDRDTILSNFMRTLAMPTTTEPWSLTSLHEKLIKIGAKVVSHGRCL